MQGKEIGEYYIKGYLKQGGYGKVYLAQSINKNLYALKHIEHGKQEKQYVIKEADRYKKLDHPNIVKIVEYFEDPKQEHHMAIVLEYCSKKDLSECLLNDKEFLKILNKQMSIKILKKITDGLVYLHQKNIIHRDIKPCNILMTEDYTPKIGDLGSSKDTQKSLNTGNNVNGTVTYLAPEVCHKKYKQDQYTSKTDVWSLGIIALELLLKRKSSTFVDDFYPAALQQDFPSEVLLNQIEDKPLRQLVQKMLTKDPKQRLTSIEVLHALQAMSPKIPVSSKQILFHQNRQQINSQEALKKVNKCFISLHKAIISDKITLREVFVNRVNQKSGKFGIMQFTKLMNNIDKTLELDQIQQVFNLIDLNDSETIEYDELNRHYCQVNGLPYFEEKLNKKGLSSIQEFLKGSKKISVDIQQFIDKNDQIKNIEKSKKFNLNKEMLSSETLKNIGYNKNLQNQNIAFQGKQSKYNESQFQSVDLNINSRNQGEKRVFPPYKQSNENSAMKLCDGCKKTNILKQFKFCYDCFQKYGNREDIYQATEINKINEQSFIHLLKTKQFFPHLKNINLYSNKITDKGLKVLIENGHKFPNLQAIGLQSNQITDEGLKALVENGHKFPSLQTINLQKNYITGKGLKTLVENGHKFLSLQTIQLQFNSITDEGLEALVENGHKFPSLQSIYLWRNFITDEGLKALAKNGQRFLSLQLIDLSGNQITGDGLKALAENGHKFPSLQTLNLQSTQITVEGLKALVENGHKFPSMVRIDLENNRITDIDLKWLEQVSSKFEYGKGIQIFGFSVTKNRRQLYVFKDKDTPSQTFLVQI